MGLSQWVGSHFAAPNKPVVVTFTGGMGAQLISAAVYLSLRIEGRAAYADFTYFDKREHVAKIGNPGEVSHWGWQLEPFGLNKDSFETAPHLAKRQVELIEDGPQKLTLGFKALRRPEVQKYFAIAEGTADILPAGFSSDYLCIHVRRGDYVNVASHLVADNEFIELARKFSGLVKYLAVVTDSPIDEPFRTAIGACFDRAVFLDNIDAFASHRIMRNARILICSNSQFSLIAALLNPRALVVLPKQWFGENTRAALEAPIHEACGFQILNPAEV